MAVISIVSVNYRSAPYLGPLLASLIAKAAEPHELDVLIVDNTNGADQEISKALESIPRARLVPFDTGPVKGSRAHAKGLDFAAKQLETEFAVVIDPDIWVFKTGWDRLCRTELDQRSAFAIGAPYPAWKVGKYHDFPSPPFCFFRTETMRELSASFEPFGKSKVEDARDLVVRQVGRFGNLLTRRRYEESLLVRRYAAWAERTLGVFGPDTGWRVAEAARARGLGSVLFEPVLAAAAAESQPPVLASAGDALAELSRQFELYTYRGEPIMTHKYGSGARPWRTARGNDTAYWRECIAVLERAAQ